MLLITSLVVVLSHLYPKPQMGKKQFLLGTFGLGLLASAAQYVPIIKNYANFDIPSGYGTAQYVLFQVVHIPESVADWWNYQIGQNGSGPAANLLSAEGADQARNCQHGLPHSEALCGGW